MKQFRKLGIRGTRFEVKTVLNRMKSGKSCGPYAGAEPKKFVSGGQNLLPKKLWTKFVLMFLLTYLINL